MKTFILFLTLATTVFTYHHACAQQASDQFDSASEDKASFQMASSPSIGAPFKAILSLRSQSSSNEDKSSSDSRACIEKVDITFERAMNVATLYGKVYGVNQYNSRRPYYIAGHSLDFRSFTFKLANASACPRLAMFKKIVVSDAITSVDGQKLSQAVELRPHAQGFTELDLEAAATDDVDGQDDEAALTMLEASAGSSVQQVRLDASPQRFTWVRQRACPSCLAVTGSDLNRAYAAVTAWEAKERNQSWYRSDLGLLPLTGTLLTPYSAFQRRNHYSSPDMTYILRRAAVFMAALYPSLQKIPLADVSDRLGETPSTMLGSEKILMHPEGSHVAGKDADVSYITVGSGHEARGQLDFEKNFWFLYSVLQSSGVDLVMTAFKDEMLSIGGKALRQGLISDHALGRFNMLMNDANLNHDKHVHISVRNADNDYRSLRGKPNDNVYNCYLALQPGRRGGNLNFCLP